MLQKLSDLQNSVSEMILGSITEGKDLIEKLLIQLLGHENATVRSCAIKYLNCIYDGTIWKLETPMSTEVMITGEVFEIKFTPTIESASYYLVLNLPYKDRTAISWHRIPNESKPGRKISFDLGKFEECGFYDYKIIRLKKDSVENIEHHRVIVHNRFIKQANFHEIVVDLFKAKKDPITGVMQTRGDLHKIAKSLNYFERKGIDTLYIAGVHKRAVDDPYSISSRRKIEEEIGGESIFKEELVDEIHERDMKIFVDLFDRIGSINMSRKNRHLLTHHINAEGKHTYLHGAEGKSNFTYFNTSILNYRKKEAWDNLINDALYFVRTYGVDGLHIDNCDLWPTMKRIDKAEMLRKDSDDEYCYSANDIMNGEVVREDSDLILWTDCTECPNPMLVKLMKALWNDFPDLMVVGECWKENSEAVVELSGVVPRSNALVKNITDDILKFSDDEEANFELFKFNDDFMKDYCKGAILLQSSYLYSSKSPIKTFHKSYLTIIDTMFFHEIVPITMHEEIEGIDGEIELYIQYFDKDQREMHGITHHNQIKRVEELMPEAELDLEEDKLQLEIEAFRRDFPTRISKRIENARWLRKEKP